MIHHIQHVASTAWSKMAPGASAVTTAFLLTGRTKDWRRAHFLFEIFLMNIIAKNLIATSVQLNSVKYSHIVVQWISRTFPYSSLSNFKKLLPKKKKLHTFNSCMCQWHYRDKIGTFIWKPCKFFWHLSPYWLDLNISCGCPRNDFLYVLGHYGDEKMM